MLILNLLFLIIIAIISASFFKNSWIKAIVTFLFVFFICMQLTSLYVGASFCDYKFFAHFNFRDFWWGASSVYKTEALFLPLGFIGIFAGIYFSSKLPFLRNKRPWLLIKSAVLGFSLLFLFISKNGIIDGLRESLIFVSLSSTDNFDVIRSNFEMEMQKQSADFVFTKKEDLQVSSEGKNIVIISLESYERAFLHGKNQYLTPNLSKLREEWNFYNMSVNMGSAWTVGALYTTFTGLPCFLLGGDVNNFFQSTQKSKLITLGDILGKADYEMYHLSEDASFAGTNDLLKTFGVQHILDGTLHNKYEEKMKDYDLFVEAKNIFKDSARTKPVMIHISTLATHPPHGIIDSRLFNYIKPANSDMETAIQQTDFLVGDFIRFLTQNNLLENTIVYILPDHLFMGNLSFLKTASERGLWFLTNARQEDLHINPTNFYQIDLPSNILSGAAIEHNAKFIGDYIKEDKDDFISKNNKLLTHYNTMSLDRENVLSNNLRIKIHRNIFSVQYNNNIIIKEHIKFLTQNDQVIFLTKNLGIQEITTLASNTFDSICDTYYDYYIRIGLKNSKLDVEWGRGSGLKRVFPPTTDLQLNSMDIEETLAAISYKTGELYRENLTKETHLLDYLYHTLQDKFKIIMISCSDNASSYFSKLNPVFEPLGLQESLCFRCSYIAVFSKEKVYYEKNDHENVIHKKLNIEGVPFYVSSEGGANKIGYMVINNINYGCSRRGLNFVIYNAKTKCVEDAFNVDFHDDKDLIINRYIDIK